MESALYREFYPTWEGVHAIGSHSGWRSRHSAADPLLSPPGDPASQRLLPPPGLCLPGPGIQAGCQPGSACPGHGPDHVTPVWSASLLAGGTVTPPSSVAAPARPLPASQRRVCFCRVLPTVISECRAAFLECLAAQCLRLRSLFQQHRARAQHRRYTLASPDICPRTPEWGGGG